MELNILMALQAGVDSLAAVIGTEVGAQVSLLIVLGLGLVSKVVTDIGKGIVGKVSVLSGPVVSVLALIFAQLIAFANAKFGTSFSGDITLLATTLEGAVIWATAMGWNSLSNTLFKKPAV